MRVIEIEKSLFQYLQTKAASDGETISETLRRELKISPPTVQIEIEDDVYNYILSKTASIGEPASKILARELHVQPDNPGANIVEFHIKHGTGNQPWNTAEEIITAKVGNILRIVNDDTVSHRPHTSGVPFPHPGSDILPGEHADYLLHAPFPSSPGAIEALYDHTFGEAAQFWIRVEQP
jgi:negative regulator of replication initiation